MRGLVVAALILTTVVCNGEPYSFRQFYQNNWYTTHANWKLIPHDECGRQSATFDQLSSPRAFGGVDAKEGQHPWMVGLFVVDPEDEPMFKCGGSIINDRYILTAAHCLNIPAESLEVRLGSRWRTDELCEHNRSRCQPSVHSAVEVTNIHPGYKLGPKRLHAENDVGLIRLKQRIAEYTDYIQPICLPSIVLINEKNFLDGKMVEAPGWGVVDSDDGSIQLSDVLQTVRVVVVGQEECVASWNKALEERRLCQGQDEGCWKVVDDQFICAGGAEGTGTCSGDSGGPLVAPQEVFPRGTRMFVVGITSHGMDKEDHTPDCGGGFPDVYMRVSEYIPWILDTIYE